MQRQLAFSALRLRWGNYYHRINEGELKISRDPMYNSRQKVCAIKERWSWTGRIRFESTSIRDQLSAMYDFENAYAIDGRDLVLETIDGVATWHTLLSRNCIGGTKVIRPPEFPKGIGNEAIAYRTYTVAVEGVMPIIGRSMILQFNETLSIRGGGERWGVREVNFGVGSRQRLRTHTACQASQSGQVTMYVGEPTIPPPVWPWALVDEYPDLTLPSATFESGVLTNRSVSWNYNFVWPTRLSGQPHYAI